MKMTMFALVLAIGMAFSAFAADEPPKIKLEGVIQQLRSTFRDLDGLSKSDFRLGSYSDRGGGFLKTPTQREALDKTRVERVIATS